MRIAILNTDRTNEALQHLRQQQCLTLADVAKIVGCSAADIHEVEQNGRMTLGQLRTVAKALGHRVEVHLISEDKI